jgi:hypothetical protein
MAATDEKQTGNAFWILFTLIAIVNLTYLAFWSFYNENLKGLAIAIILSILLIFTHIISRGEVFQLKGSFRKNAFWFTIGFIIWGAVIVGKRFAQTGTWIFSVLSTVTPQSNVLFAEISQDLPTFWQFIIDNINNPFVEEAFWLIGLPYAVIWLFDILSKEREHLEFLGNPVVKFLATIILCGVTFPIFHVRGLVIAFIMSALIFRTLIIVFYWGDELLDMFPDLKVIASFAVGMHMANNWVEYGFFKGIQVLSTNYYGWFILAIFGTIILATIDYIIEQPLKLVPEA